MGSFEKIGSNVTAEGLVKAISIKWKVEDFDNLDGFVFAKRWGLLEERQVYVPKDEVTLETDENGETVLTLCKISVSNSKNELVIENPEDKEIKGIAEGAFAGNSTVEKIILPDTIEHIDKLAFRGCSSLASITIPEGVTSIGDQAFYDCKSLQSVTIEATTPPTAGRVADDSV